MLCWCAPPPHWINIFKFKISFQCGHGRSLAVEMTSSPTMTDLLRFSCTTRRPRPRPCPGNTASRAMSCARVIAIASALMARTHLLHEVVFVQQMKVGLAVHAQFLQHLRVVLRKPTEIRGMHARSASTKAEGADDGYGGAVTMDCVPLPADPGGITRTQVFSFLLRYFLSPTHLLRRRLVMASGDCLSA